MQKFFLLLAAMSVFGGMVSLSTGQGGLVTGLFFGVAAVLFIAGLRGDKP